MKKIFTVVSLLVSAAMFESCGILGKRKSGCPPGRNVGAERILSGDKKAIQIASKKSKLKI
jgi:hypothetical protein